MKTTIESSTRYTVVLSQLKEQKEIILQSKLNDKQNEQQKHDNSNRRL